MAIEAYIRTAIDNLRRAARDRENDLRRKRTELGNLQRRRAEIYSDYDNQIASTERGIDRQLSQLNAQLADQERDLSAIQRELDDAQRRLGSAQQTANIARVAVERIEDEEDEQRQQNEQEAAAANEEAGRIEQNIADLQRRLAEQEGAIAATRQQIDEANQNRQQIMVMQRQKSQELAEHERVIQDTTRVLPMIEQDVHDLDQKAAEIQQRLASPPPA